MRPEEIIPQGSGSGLDADTLDGYHLSDIVSGRAVLLVALLGALLYLGGLIMPIDASHTGRASVIDPISNAVVVTPSDSSDLEYVTTSLRIASAGSVRVTLLGGTTVTYPSGALAVGVSHPMRVVRVHATGTTAGGIVAEW